MSDKKQGLRPGNIIFDEMSACDRHTQPIIDWLETEKRLKHYRHLFMKNNHFHLFNLEQLQARFDEGERTPELASEIEVIIGNGD